MKYSEISSKYNMLISIRLINCSALINFYTFVNDVFLDCINYYFFSFKLYTCNQIKYIPSGVVNN